MDNVWFGLVFWRGLGYWEEITPHDMNLGKEELELGSLEVVMAGFQPSTALLAPWYDGYDYITTNLSGT